MTRTEDEILPEIHLHSDYMEWFERNGIEFKSWGSAGPDFLLTTKNMIGEVKRRDSITAVKDAIKEIFARTQDRFKISNFDSFFIIAGDSIRVYKQTKMQDYQKININECIIFNERELFLQYLNNSFCKIPVESNLEYAIDFLLDEQFEMCISDGMQILFNLNNPNIAFVKNAVYFNPDTDDEIYIKYTSNKTVQEKLKNFIKIFSIHDINKVKEYIKHSYSSHLPDSKKANLGKYYTPSVMVNMVRDLVRDEVNDNSYVLDLACGCGAFLEIFKDCHIIGRDIDSQAIDILTLFNFHNIGLDNSLLNVSREKYGLSDSDDLIIIGNPPYNDSSSINKRYSTKSKAKRLPEDKDIHCRDVGRSFLEAYAKLKPRIICVLHPLAFLIKKANFNNLKHLSSSYKLQKATIFRSDIFKDLKGGSVFPIVIAFYRSDPDGMNYEYIQNFIFDIYGTNSKFTLTSVVQADHKLIHQTVTSKDKDSSSDIHLYHYNFRDINSLNKANFKNEYYRELHRDSMVVVNFEELWKYCYVNCVKKFLIPLLPEDNNYILGNLNPIIDLGLIESEPNYWKDLFISASILKNIHRIEIFNIKYENNILTSKFLLNDFRRRGNSDFFIKHPEKNFYSHFLNFIEYGDERDKDFVCDLVIDYFKDLVKKCFIQ